MGQGNYGKVARAKYHSPDERQLTCVVKVIGRQNETEDDAKLFEREVMALSKAKHQRIVQMWEHFKFSRAYIITMEYCPRGTLDTLLGELPQGQYFSHDFAFLFCKDLASALHFLHEQNIVHRDLKPENVLFDRNKRLKLADFGFAKKLTSRSMRNTICFSEAFCAPELLRSPSPHHDPKKLDVSGYGLLCYLVFTTKLPFQLEVIKPRDEFAPLPPLDITPKLKWEHQKVNTLHYPWFVRLNAKVFTEGRACHPYVHNSGTVLVRRSDCAPRPATLEISSVDRCMCVICVNKEIAFTFLSVLCCLCLWLDRMVNELSSWCCIMWQPTSSTNGVQVLCSA